MGIGNENRLQVPAISEEVDRTKRTIKQKAAELTKKTRSSFRRGKNGGGGQTGFRKLKLPRERKQRRYRPRRNKISEDITEEFNGEEDNDENDDDEGSLLSHYE